MSGERDFAVGDVRLAVGGVRGALKSSLDRRYAAAASRSAGSGMPVRRQYIK